MHLGHAGPANYKVAVVVAKATDLFIHLFPCRYVEAINLNRIKLNRIEKRSSIALFYSL
jgi:hypothetical protein